MAGSRRITASLIWLACVASIGSPAPSFAACHVNRHDLAIATQTLDLGVPAPSPRTTTRALSFVIAGTYDTDAAAGGCKLALSIAPLARTAFAELTKADGGHASLPYAIQAIQHMGSANTVPILLARRGSAWELPLASAGPNLAAQPFKVSLALQVAVTPDLLQPAGSYLDGLVASIADPEGGTFMYTHELALMADVLTSCSASALELSLDAAINADAPGGGDTPLPMGVSCNTPFFAVRTREQAPLSSVAGRPQGQDHDARASRTPVDVPNLEPGTTFPVKLSVVSQGLAGEGQGIAKTATEAGADTSPASDGRSVVRVFVVPE